jgi:hypothetical protein
MAAMPPSIQEGETEEDDGAATTGAAGDDQLWASLSNTETSSVFGSTTQSIRLHIRLTEELRQTSLEGADDADEWESDGDDDGKSSLEGDRSRPGSAALYRSSSSQNGGETLGESRLEPPPTENPLIGAEAS